MQSYATTTQMMSHQLAAVEKVRPSRVGGLFMEMGTGKSRTAIELVNMRARNIDKAIWYCPVTLKETVRQEILKHTDCRDIHVFDDKTNPDTLPKARWYVCGIESMSSSARVIAAANKLTTSRTKVILDESSYIKGHNSLRTQRLTRISERAKYRLILTGTPISQGVVDLYSQMRFLSPKILGYNSFYSFAANHLEYSDKFPGMIVRAHNMPYLAAKMAPYLYQVTKKECLDLPPKTYEARYFYMTYEQRDLYEKAKDELLGDIEDFDSVTIFRLFTALQKIVSGYSNRKDGAMIEMEHRRIDTLISTIGEIPLNEKVIIFAKFRYDIESIGRALREASGEDSVAIYDGSLSERQRANELERFRREARFFLATQSTGGHGLTLNEAHYVIFYNNGFKYAERLQAEDRCHRIGQGQPVTYIDICCIDSIDTRIEDSMLKKGNAVSSFRAEVDKIKGKRTALRDLVKSL